MYSTEIFEDEISLGILGATRVRFCCCLSYTTAKNTSSRVMLDTILAWSPPSRLVALFIPHISSTYCIQIDPECGNSKQYSSSTWGVKSWYKQDLCTPYNGNSQLAVPKSPGCCCMVRVSTMRLQ